jgi:hypothetical protein
MPVAGADLQRESGIRRDKRRQLGAQGSLPNGDAS